MEVFAERFLLNVVNNPDDEENSSRIVNLTLLSLQKYCSFPTSLKYLGQTPIMQNIISNGINTYQILQEPHQMKQLGQFYNILVKLWLKDEYI